MSQATADITARSTISIPTSEELGESRFLIHCLDWDGYVKLLKLFGDDGPRVSYLDGVIELMSPGPLHEERSHVLGTMITLLTMELDIPAKGQASTTYKRSKRKRGFEADQCFYLASLGLIRGKDLKTLKPLPPPDLAIEVEVTSALLDKLDIYAGMGVPEVWRHNQDGLTILVLGAGWPVRPRQPEQGVPVLAARRVPRATGIIRPRQ